MAGFRKRALAIAMIGVMCMSVFSTVLLSGCSKGEEKPKETTLSKEEKENVKLKEKAREIKVSIDLNNVHQTIEGFGASGAWWSQNVGGWTKIQKNGLETREWIAQLLFDRENGIGLNTYRYNVGGGSADSGNCDIGDKWRRAESFETAPGVYDFTKDANAVWFMNRAVELGATEVVMFANSPLERFTISGKAHGDANAASKSNLAPENYAAYSNYFLDVVEHFVEEGLPIKFISPLNEPQWDWTSGQEGCHFEPQEVVDFLKVFIEELEKRPTLAGVELSAPESGEWGNTNYKYMEAIFADEVLANYFTSLDCHSYWSDKAAKTKFKSWLTGKGYEDMVLRTSEWCEMVNGTDYTMDSAVNLAKEINDDLTVLDVVSWQYWIAVSCYNYRDGLIYVTTANEVVVVPKRLWAMGNFSKFVLTGYQRVEADSTGTSLEISAFTGNNGTEDQVVVVMTNTSSAPVKYKVSDLNLGENFKLYVTDETHNLEESTSERYEDGYIYLSGQSVNTLVVSK